MKITVHADELSFHAGRGPKYTLSIPRRHYTEQPPGALVIHDLKVRCDLPPLQLCYLMRFNKTIFPSSLFLILLKFMYTINKHYI